MTSYVPMLSQLQKSILFAAPVALLLAFAVGSANGADEPAAPASWELSPYRIKLMVAVDQSAAIPIRWEEDLPAELKARAAAVIGSAWRLEIEPVPQELRHTLLTALPTLEAKDVPAAALQADKFILLAIRDMGKDFQIRARELDVVTGLWNTTATIHVRQKANVSREAFRAVLTAFAPLARMETTEDETITLRFRAGALPRRDRTLPPIATGVVFRPVLATCDARGSVKPGETKLIPGTFLQPSEAVLPGSAVVKCRVVTNLAGAVIPPYHPRQQRWALAVTPSTDSSRLRLVSQGTPPEPLEGCDVFAADESDSTALGTAIGRSDRNGLVTIPPGSLAARMLVVRQGDDILARFPLMPGLQEETTMPLLDSRARLQLQANLARLQDDLIDQIAQREVLVGRIREALQRGDAGSAQKLFQQLRDASTGDKLLENFTQQQQALESVDSQTRRGIQEKLAELRKLLDQFKTDSPVAKMQAELDGAASKK